MKDVIKAALSKLIGDADSIAIQLNLLGIKGIRCNGKTCPLANYLKQLTNFNCHITCRNITVLGTEEYVLLSKDLSDFVINFDKQLYPELMNDRPTA